MTVSLKKPTFADLYPGWKTVACYCHNGLVASYSLHDMSPVECSTCGGNGQLWLTPSGSRLALYPGGPFAGVASAADRRVAKVPA